MSFCPNCGNLMDPSANFCKNCGAAVTEPGMAPAMTTPPVYYKRRKVLGFVGMGLSVGGVAMAGIGLLYTLIGLMSGIMAFIFSLFFGFYSIPLSLVGGVLSDKARSMGNPSSVCTIGSKLRIVGIIISVAMLFLGVIGLFVAFLLFGDI